MEVLNYASLLISVYTGALLVTQALGQLLVRPLRAYRILSAVLLVWTSLFLFSIGLGRELWLEYLPHLYCVHIPLYYLAGPLLQAYVLGVLDERDVAALSDAPRAGRRLLIFSGYARFVPFFIAVAICLPAFVLPREMKVAMFEFGGDGYLQMYGRLVVAVAVVGLLSAGLAAVRLFLKLRIFDLLRSEGGSPTIWHFRVLLIWLAVSIPLALLAQWIGDPVWKRGAVAFFSLGILWFYLLDYRYPRFFHRIDREIRSRHLSRYERSKIRNVNAAAIAETLEQTMTGQRLYADEDLTLSDLAAVAGIHPAQLSELLNNVMGMDFRRYVNEFRVNEAKSLLLEEPERSALDIGYTVGFNSKTAFNRNFKAIAGLTPTEYREAAAGGAKQS